MIKDSLNESFLVGYLSKRIVAHHEEVLRITNYEVIALFVKIGEILNQYGNINNKQEFEGLFIDYLSEKLVPVYGDYFNKNNLESMSSLSVKLRDNSALAQVINFFSWEHITLVHPLTYPEQWFFYLTLTVKENLSAEDLHNRILANSFSQLKVNEKEYYNKGGQDVNDISEFYYNLIGRTDIVKKLVRNPFQYPLEPSFRLLIEPKTPETTIFESTSSTNQVLEAINIIVGEIGAFQKSLNSGLSGRFNQFINEVGERVNNVIEKIPSERDLFFEGLSSKLKDGQGKFFTELNLRSAADFANRFGEHRINTCISYLVTWRHILALLTLEDTDAVLFYAKLVASQGLSVNDLQYEIKKNTYKHTAVAKEREQKTFDLMNEEKSSTTIDKKGNFTFEITEVIVDYGDDLDSSLAVRNIFNNEDFLNFITAF